MTKIADKAKKKAWNDFKERYSNADQGKIGALVSFGEASSRPGQKPKRQFSLFKSIRWRSGECFRIR